jgi:hypothetical protein
MIDLVLIQDAIENNDQHHEQLCGNGNIVITQMKFDTTPCPFVVNK